MKTIINILVIFSFAFNCFAESPPNAAVASARSLSTEAGIEILKAGGNAIDAAVAISATLAVVEPASSGLGGGGFWLIHRESDGKQVMIDGREKAPGFAYRQMYLDENDEVRRSDSLNGPKAGGIPGIPAGIVYLALNYGRLSLQKSLAPAIRYAEKGFPVTPDYQAQVRRRAEVIKQFPSSAAIFLQNGQVPKIGYKIVQSDLAKTLRSIAAHGIDGFYFGPLAKKLVGGVQQYGGIWQTKDLEDYRVLERAPFTMNYRNIKVVTGSPPSSGMVIGQALKILEHFNLSGMDRVARAHHVIEALRRANRDRAVFLGDPDFVNIPVNKLLDENYIDGMAITIDPQKATSSDELGNTPGLDQSGTSTTHFSVIDNEGNRVAGTLSINISFGSGFVIPGTGVLVNNEMDDFSSKPNTPNAYGLIGFTANAIEPGKRPLSSMSPTFVESDERIGILGTPGGSRIISMVLLGILAFADGQLPEYWVDLPRYHHQYRPDVVQFEQNTFTEQEKAELVSRGHKLSNRTRSYGDMHAIMWDKRTGHVYAASDKRGEGVAKVIVSDP